MRIQTAREHLKPGESINISIIIRGERIIPGIAHLRGYANAAWWIFEDEMDVPPDFDSGYHPRIFRVVGPVPKPTDRMAMMDRLIEITTGSHNEGWITKQGIHQALIAKLNAAREKVRRGASHYHTARNILGAFKNQLDAQRGKAINEECYQMLTINADVMIGML